MASARYEGRFLHQSRGEDGAIHFAEFRATELINFTFDTEGVPASILSYFVNVTPHMEVTAEWQAYLSNAKAMSPAALAAAVCVQPTCAGNLALEDLSFRQQHAKSSPGSSRINSSVASGNSIAEVPDSIVVVLEKLWHQVRWSHRARYITA